MKSKKTLQRTLKSGAAELNPYTSNINVDYSK
jgi:hypothetical protein